MVEFLFNVVYRINLVWEQLYLHITRGIYTIITMKPEYHDNYIKYH